MIGLIPTLTHMGACKRSINWIFTNQFPTFAATYEACEIFSDLIWLAGRLAGQQTIVKIAVDIAKTSIYAEAYSSMDALDAALRWVEDPTEDNRLTARALGIAARWRAPSEAARAAGTEFGAMAAASYADRTSAAILERDETVRAKTESGHIAIFRKHLPCDVLENLFTVYASQKGLT